MMPVHLRIMSSEGMGMLELHMLAVVEVAGCSRKDPCFIALGKGSGDWHVACLR